MSPSYSRKAWSKVEELEILDCIEEVYSRKRYSTKNYHRADRRHELGVDLLCKKDNEQIAFAVKKKPRKEDIRQLNSFIKNTEGMRRIYVHIDPPTRPFEDELKKVQDRLEIWDSDRLHKELVSGASPYYLSLYFSSHPIFENLTGSIRILHKTRRANYVPHRFTSEEADAIWLLKDNIVKMRSTLLQIYMRWAAVLMTRTERLPDEYQSILDAIFKDLDIANSIAGNKLLISFKDLSNKHPNILGLYWNLVRQRTGWNRLTYALDELTESHDIERIIFDWILGRSLGVMRDFYSSVNYTLENFHNSAKDLEDGLDWVFVEMNTPGSKRLV